MKIVKNKNKNGRIVIVLSKYMESGMQAVKIQVRGGSRGRRAPPATRNGLLRITPSKDFQKGRGGRRRESDAT